ncbi:MAG: hypothetical protein M1821_002554 [Bathelium mastoideum]|nr:MAG: hypothetical protein M1821_002554 [Bathelium mastoideum]
MRRQLPGTIEICYSETLLAEGSNPNKSIAAILATKPKQHHDWRGPIIAYGKEGLGVNQPFCRDLDMTDFRQVADYFLSYKYSPTPGLQPFLDLKIKGVRINCIGDQELFEKRQFEAVEIPLTDSIFTKHDTSDIAKRIGLPIFTRCYPPSPGWVNNQDNKIFKGKIAFSNRDASFLHLCCDPNAKFEQSTGRSGWGFASMQWQNSVGSVLVVRQDKKPLFPSLVEALCKYCRYQISPLMAHSHGEYAPEEPMEKDAVLSMICRPTFVIFWHKLLHAKVKEEG